MANYYDLQFTHAAGSTNGFIMRWRSGIGQRYVIQRSTNLADGFAPIATNAGTPTCNTYTDAVEDLDRACYRLRVE